MTSKTQFRPAPPFRRVDGVIHMALVDQEGALAGTLPLGRPKPMTLSPEALVIGSALNSYGSASNLQQLMGSFADKFFVEHMFNFTALYPDFTSLGIVMSPQYAYLIAEVNSQPVVAWWIPNTSLLNLSVEIGHTPRDQGVFKTLTSQQKILPSELIYALSILAAHNAIGSDQFVITRDAEFITTMWNDVEQRDYFMGVNFPRQDG